MSLPQQTSRSYRPEDVGNAIAPEDAPLPRPPPEMTNAEPRSVAERAGAMLDAASDGPVTTFLAQAVKGMADSPVTHLAVKTNPLLRILGKTQEFDDFLTTMSAKSPQRSGSDAGRMVGAFIPEALAYSAATSAGASLGALGMKSVARTATIAKYFESLANPALAGLPKPAIVRAGEILGTAIANGGLAGAEEAASGGPTPLHSALVVGGLSFGLEGALTVGAKAVSRGAREVSKQVIARKWAGSEARSYLQTAEGEFRAKLLKQSKRVGAAVREEAFEKQLQGMVPAFLPPTAKAARQYAKAQATGLAEAVGKRVNSIRKLHQASGSLQVARRYAGVTEREILAGAYVSERPTNFDSTFGSLRAAWRVGFATPDAIRKEIGVAGEYGLRSLDDAVLLGFGRWNSSLEMLKRIRGNVEEVVGKKTAMSVLHDLEDGGEALVRQNLTAVGYTAHQANKVMSQLDLVTNGGDALHELIKRFGGEPSIDTAKMGVARYLPQLVRRGAMSDDEFIGAMRKHLVKKGFAPDEATRRALDVIEARKARGFQRFGSIDDRRLIPGTTREKIAAGLRMEADPWKAYAQYFGGMHQRIALSQVLGFKNEMLPKLVHAVEVEAGPGAASLFRSSVESMAGLKYYKRLTETFATQVTSAEAAAKMGFSFVPNMYQFALNNPLIYGLRNTFTGMREMAGNHAPGDLRHALGFMASDFFDLGLRSNMMSDMSEGILSKLARMTLRLSGFNRTERFNRGSAAFGAHAVMTDILAKAHAGRLRGNNLTFARKVFEEAGLDLGRVVREGVTQEEYIAGALRLMRRTQFSAGEGTRAIRPLAWQTPLGRVLFQFNTFTLNQARLLRDFVFNEVAKGDKKQLARFLGIYLPMAEVSVATQDMVREAVTGRGSERPSSPVVRALEDMLYAGSFGMANTMFWAAKGGRMEKLLGPAVTDFFTYGEALMSGRFAEVGRRLVSLPSVQLFTAAGTLMYRGGTGALGAAQKYLEAADADNAAFDDDPAPSALTLRDFREAETEKRRLPPQSRRSYRPSR